MGDLNHPKGVYERLDRIQLVDCREQDEWDAGRIDGAILLPSTPSCRGRARI